MTPAEKLARAVLLVFDNDKSIDISQELKTVLGDDTQEALKVMARAVLARERDFKRRDQT